MRYKIGDVARILGISTDLIRYYEEKGVVCPKKDGHNNYRYYDAWDINFLIDCLWYKNFGFGIDEIAKMTSEGSYGALVENLDDKAEEILEMIRHQEMLLNRIRSYCENVRHIKGYVGKCDIRKNKEFIYYLNRFNSTYENNADLNKTSRQWLKYMPFSKRFFEVPAQDILGEGDDYAWGFSLGMQYVEEFGVSVKQPVKHMPSRTCIHSAFKSSGKNAFTARHLDFMAEFAEKNGLRVIDRAFGNLACSIVENEQITGYFEVWLPVEEIEPEEK